MPTKNNVKFYIHLFEWFGIASGRKFTAKPKSLPQQILHCWPLLFNPLAMLTELWAAYTYRNIAYHPSTTIGALSDIIQVLGPIFATGVMVGESLFHGRLEETMWTTIEGVDRRVEAANMPDDRMPFERRFLLKFVLVSGIGIGTDVFILVQISEKEPEWARCMYFCLWSVNVARIGILQVVLYLEWVVHRFGFIERRLLLAGGLSLSEQQRIVQMTKEIYCELWLFVKHINKRFDLTLFLNITNYFVCVTISFYWVITRVYFNKLEFLVRKFMGRC